MHFLMNTWKDGNYQCLIWEYLKSEEKKCSDLQPSRSIKPPAVLINPVVFSPDSPHRVRAWGLGPSISTQKMTSLTQTWISCQPASGVFFSFSNRYQFVFFSIVFWGYPNSWMVYGKKSIVRKGWQLGVLPWLRTPPYWDLMWVKQCHKPPILERFTPIKQVSTCKKHMAFIMFCHRLDHRWCALRGWADDLEVLRRSWKATWRPCSGVRVEKSQR